MSIFMLPHDLLGYVRIYACTSDSCCMFLQESDRCSELSAETLVLGAEIVAEVQPQVDRKEVLMLGLEMLVPGNSLYVHVTIYHECRIQVCMFESQSCSQLPT